MRKVILLASVALALVAPGAIARSSPAPALAAKSWSTFRDGFVERFFQLDPYSAVYEGRHEFDGQLPDWSDAGLKRQADLFRATLARARAFPVAGLTAQERFERGYLIKVVEGKLFWLADADRPHSNPAY